MIPKRAFIIALAACCLFPFFAEANAADSSPGSGAGMKTVGVAEFEKLRTDKKNVVLDVRTEKEFAAGHIPGAVNIDVNAPDFEDKVKKLDKDKTYLVHCAAGVRSRKACEKMGKLNFRHCITSTVASKNGKKPGTNP